MPWQLAWIVVVQMIEPWVQHEPMGGQGFIATQLSCVDGTEPGGQVVPIARKHNPVDTSQHVVNGGKQVMPTQVVPIPMKVPLQAVALGTSVQLPVLGSQHAPPVAWHGFGVQLPLARKT